MQSDKLTLFTGMMHLVLRLMSTNAQLTENSSLSRHAASVHRLVDSSVAVCALCLLLMEWHQHVARRVRVSGLKLSPLHAGRLKTWSRRLGPSQEEKAKVQLEADNQIQQLQLLPT